MANADKCLAGITFQALVPVETLLGNIARFGWVSVV